MADNVLTAGNGNDQLAGGLGNDQLIGNGGDDKLTGDAGTDNLDGGAGNDVLDGGSGNDTMTGGAGNDLYIIDSLGDAVTDSAGSSDTVQSADISLLSRIIWPLLIFELSRPGMAMSSFSMYSAGS